MIGFHVIHQFLPDKTTHVYLSKADAESLELSKSLVLALCHRKIFITESWLKGMEVGDLEYCLKKHTKEAEPIVINEWESFKQQAILGPDDRRKTLFDGVEFWFFDASQVLKYSTTTLIALITAT